LGGKRREIHAIEDDSKLDQATLDARKAEEERQVRIVGLCVLLHV
jgi:hypothetical protein